MKSINNIKKSTMKAKSEVKQKIKSKTKPFKVGDKMSKLGSAYKDAISGKIKFGEVKEIFRQLHKEIKSSLKGVKTSIKEVKNSIKNKI